VRYQIRPALFEEVKEGWVWLSPAATPFPGHIRIYSPAMRRWIVCEQRVIDTTFRRIYNDPSKGRTLPSQGSVLVISAYYRDRLGLESDGGSDIELEIRQARGPIAGVIAGVTHPSSAVRTATWLGLLSIVLGGLSLGIALILR